MHTNPNIPCRSATEQEHNSKTTRAKAHAHTSQKHVLSGRGCCHRGCKTRTRAHSRTHTPPHHPPDMTSSCHVQQMQPKLSKRKPQQQRSELSTETAQAAWGFSEMTEVSPLRPPLPPTPSHSPSSGSAPARTTPPSQTGADDDDGKLWWCSTPASLKKLLLSPSESPTSRQ